MMGCLFLIEERDPRGVHPVNLLELGGSCELDELMCPVASRNERRRFLV